MSRLSCGAGQDKAATLGCGQGIGLPPMEEQAVTRLQQQKAVLTSLAVDPGMSLDNTHILETAANCCRHS